MVVSSLFGILSTSYALVENLWPRSRLSFGLSYLRSHVEDANKMKRNRQDTLSPGLYSKALHSVLGKQYLSIGVCRWEDLSDCDITSPREVNRNHDNPAGNGWANWWMLRGRWPFSSYLFVKFSHTVNMNALVSYHELGALLGKVTWKWTVLSHVV